MNKIMRKVYNVAGKIAASLPSDTSQTSTKNEETKEYNKPQVSAICRRAAAEGMVMLKNNGVLPLDKEDKISVFSRVQNDWFYMGYGSGGDVNSPYYISLMEGLHNAGAKINADLEQKYKDYCKKHPKDTGVWARWPTNLEEMKLSQKDINNAAAVSDKAIVIIGRSSGEDMDNRYEKGSWFLDNNEIKLLDGVTAAFDKVILLLNCSNIMDMSGFEKYGDKISAIIYTWQGGMESGNAVADILYGKVNPSGKLTDTIADCYGSYPCSNEFNNKDCNVYVEDIYVGYRYFETFAKNNVLYPFGFGLSYTIFSLENAEFSRDEQNITVSVSVKNTGKVAGKEAVQIYCEAPQGRLGKPARVLIGFEKTGLINPDESERVSITIPINSLASYDDEELYSYILEKGTYIIYLGTDVRSAEECGSFVIEEDTITEKLSQISAPEKPFKRMKCRDGKLVYEDTPVQKTKLKEVILASLPKKPDCKKPEGKVTLTDVKEGRISLDEFVLTLSEEELEAISRGDYTMDSPLGTTGNAGVYGGVLESLRDKGIPALTFTDGPTGIRLNKTATLIPIGTCLACSFDRKLVEDLYTEIGIEMNEIGSDVIAAPGMNIHRNPLCGRNFEYYSEDPLMTGVMATAAVKGIQKNGAGACPKHFTCNNQEKYRVLNDSQLSERALREIYLKGFEICVKEANPLNIMTSYNKINGVWGHYNYWTVTSILRREWGYENCVITDWWMQSSASPEFPSMKDQAYRVRGGINIFMPGGERNCKRIPDGTLLETLGKEGGITIEELRENAKYVIAFTMKFLK